MPFLQKKPQTSVSAPLYTLGAQMSVLIVGLGNPGKKYNGTRHNVGFMCVDALAAANDFPAWILKKDLECELAQATLGEARVILIKPTTFMNLSDTAVQKVMNFYKIALERLVVVHDELDIPFGQIRTRVGGGSAGHNGVKSIIERCGETFGRVRIGIGPKVPEVIDSSDFVLQKFTTDEAAQLPALTREVTAILTEHIFATQPLPAETRSFIV